MTAVQVAVVGAGQIALNFARAGEQSNTAVRAIVTHYGHLLRTQVMRNASGRPGPNVVTGDYRRSITVVFIGSAAAGEYTAVVGTNNPQGRRLEFGFHGADSLGRVYNQPPFPHFGPALDFLAPQFIDALRAATSFSH